MKYSKIYLNNDRVTLLNINKTNLKTEYNFWETFDSSALEVSITYSDGFI